MNKITDINSSLISFVIGVRFRPNFSIEDKLGNILDRVLYDKKTYFTPQVFSKVQNDVNRKTLFNPETGNYLSIDSENIILDFSLPDDSKNELISEIANAFNNQIIDGILKDFSITQINRIGYLKRYVINVEGLAKNFVDKAIGSSLDNVNDINLKFSKKIVDPTAIAKKDINDYVNVIYNIVKRSDDNDKLLITLDYQKYFLPFLERSTQTEFEKFIKKGDEYNSKVLVEWLNKHF